MQSSIKEIPEIIGTLMGGGFYAGRIRVGDQAFALIVAPKATGQISLPWNGKLKTVEGAQSYCDGLVNTESMAEAGSKLGKWALGLEIEGHTDWYIPSQDELEIIYRNLKPTTEENYCYARSGINVSALTPTYPYTPDLPAQTQTTLFQADNDEAFDPSWYWSSTQHASYSAYAWCQHFGYGLQDGNREGYELRARAVRRLPI